jgi:hypothetical protein
MRQDECSLSFDDQVAAVLAAAMEEARLERECNGGFQDDEHDDAPFALPPASSECDTSTDMSDDDSSTTSDESGGGRRKEEGETSTRTRDHHAAPLHLTAPSHGGPDINQPPSVSLVTVTDQQERSALASMQAREGDESGAQHRQRPL